MQFQRLRLVGFKSFVDPAEVLIEPGLTGVVGPNGCGKSNVLEALRWVMGANSAKAMRGQGMDDVIFAGASQRPARSHAEVRLTIDNAAGLAPHPFADAAVIEVTRRIDRGEGSTYRINGKAVRARDVQLLFADASTGANSPALVRQGQISELIAAKPQNRRRILEEAGGVSGLHGRRHEAELRLNASEANLARLDDIGRELEGQLTRLRREARQAERYRRLSAEIRALQAALVWVRWNDARRLAEDAGAALDQADRNVGEAQAAAARAQTVALTAQEALKPAREEDAVAAALLHRVTLERDRLDQAERQARAEAARLAAEAARIAADLAREAEMARDAKAELERLAEARDALATEIATAPARGPDLETTLESAEAGRLAAEGEVERLTTDIAAAEARRAADEARRRDARGGLDRAKAQLAATQAERDELGSADTSALAHAEAEADRAQAALIAARRAIEVAEAERGDRARTEQAAREAARAVEDRLGRLQTEARGLAQLLVPTRRDHPPALDRVRTEPGLEAALAAALGDDLEAALTPDAAAHWAGSEAGAPPAWPDRVTLLAQQVIAPPQLAARLTWCAVASREDAPGLARGLPVGARLVTREGDLYRWDGFVRRAEAARPSAVRLEQRRRLDEVEAEIDTGRPALDAAQAGLKAAGDALHAADAVVKAARAAPLALDKAAVAARERVDALAREGARRDARAQALDEAAARLAAEVGTAEAAMIELGDVGDLSDTSGDARARLEAARRRADEARAAAVAARVERDTEAREAAGRQARLDALIRDHDSWAARAGSARRRTDGLEADAGRTAFARQAAEGAPERLATQRAALNDGFAATEARRRTAADALAAAESTATEADRAVRAADAEAARVREARAGLAARADAAGERLAEAEAQVRETAGISPEDLGRRLAEQASARPDDAAGAETLLAALEREREALGAVNLRAETEAAEAGARLDALKTERADLTGAIARLRAGIDELNAEGRQRLTAAFEGINTNFKLLFQTLFDGGQAELKLVESDDPLEAGLEIYACPPGKRLAVMSLMSGGEQALTAAALIFGVFLANPAPVCVLDEVDAPLDDANVDRFCRMLDEMRRRTDTRFLVITHNPVTMSRMDRLYGVTMPERGVSQLVSVDLGQAERMVA